MFFLFYRMASNVSSQLSLVKDIVLREEDIPRPALNQLLKSAIYLAMILMITVVMGSRFGHLILIIKLIGSTTHFSITLLTFLNHVETWTP